VEQKPTLGAAEAAERARQIHSKIPEGGLFAGLTWRTATAPFPLGAELATTFDKLGRVLHQFYKAVNLLYRQSLAGKQPSWVAKWLDAGKDQQLLEWQRAQAFKNEIPRVIRPDIILTEDGFKITELDSVPGGIGLTAWLNQTYSEHAEVVGGADGMLTGFEGIFGEAARVSIIVSEESATYRPEMEWVAQQLTPGRFRVLDSSPRDIAPGEAVYRFFELFDLPNVACAGKLFEAATAGQVTVTPPPKPIFEEKLLFALFWNRNLRDFWRQQLGESFFAQLQKVIPYTWVVDPAPLPPHGAIPVLNLTDWQQLKNLSQRERELILKISGYSPQAWGSRGVHLGSDLPLPEWSKAVDEALASFDKNPFVLQQFHKPRTLQTEWFDLDANKIVPMQAKVRLCPYYFLHGAGDQARPKLGGVLATLNPADKKIIHGMTDAVLAPCSI